MATLIASPAKSAEPRRVLLGMTALQLAHIVLFAAVVAFNALSSASSKPFNGETNSEWRGPH
jgi:hypothetical protein